MRRPHGLTREQITEHRREVIGRKITDQATLARIARLLWPPTTSTRDGGGERVFRGP